MNLNSKILIFGASGLIGSELLKLLKSKGFKNLHYPSRSVLDLINFKKTFLFIKKNKPEIVFNFAAKVGGIKANDTKSFDFICDNTLISMNLLSILKKIRPKLIVQPSSACFYPKSDEKICETEILNGKIEYTNLAYAASKINSTIGLLSLHKQYKVNVCIPTITNTYGVNDKFFLEGAHVIPDLFSKFLKAKKKSLKKVILTGKKTTKREFIYAEDVANAIYHIIKKKYFNKIINVGHEQEISIGVLAKKIKKITKYQGEIFYNGKFSGPKRKCLNSSILLKKLMWKNNFNIDEGLTKVYQNIIDNF